MRLKRLRANSGKTQLQMAELLGVTQATYSNWESGRHEIDNESLKRLADYFNVTIDYLLGRNNDMLDDTIYTTNRVKELRIKKELSQADLAKAMNVHQTAISQWETDKTKPDMSTAILLAQFFNVTTDYLLGITDNHQPEQDQLNPLTGKKMTSREKKQLNEILENAQALFFDEEISDDDKERLIRDMTEMFWEAKEMNRRKK